MEVKVSVTDNFIRGKPSWITDAEREFRGFLDIVTHDIVTELPHSITTANINYIIHAASIASPIVYRRFPIETMDANVIGLRRLLDHCDLRAKNNSDLDGFLFFSSSEIYGNQSLNVFLHLNTITVTFLAQAREPAMTVQKIWRNVVCKFCKEKGIPIKIARPFNNYGPGLNLKDGRVIPDFAKEHAGWREYCPIFQW